MIFDKLTRYPFMMLDSFEKSVKNKSVKRREFKADEDARQYILDRDGRKIIL